MQIPNKCFASMQNLNKFSHLACNFCLIFVGVLWWQATQHLLVSFGYIEDLT